MNAIQKEKMFEIFEEVIVDDTYTREKGPFSFKVHRSPDSTKVVIECHHPDNLIMFYTIDYQSQEFLPDCNGINRDEDKFFLNCEMKGYPPRIFYALDEDLTSEFNNRYLKDN